MRQLSFVAAFGGICCLNALIGWRWSKLDRNPWSGKFAGGTFSRPAPGLNPGGKSVEEIRAYGRRMMMFQPYVFLIAAIIYRLSAR